MLKGCFEVIPLEAGTLTLPKSTFSLDGFYILSCSSAQTRACPAWSFPLPERHTEGLGAEAESGKHPSLRPDRPLAWAGFRRP